MTIALPRDYRMGLIAKTGDDCDQFRSDLEDDLSQRKTTGCRPSTTVPLAARGGLRGVCAYDPRG
jgi:hypothetical protein